LRHHPLIHDDTGEFFDGTSFWERWLHAAGVSGGIPHSGPHFSHTVLAIEAAVEGLGVVATVPMLAAPELDSGRLVMPFELQVPLESSYLLLSTEAATDRPAVIAFREWLLAEAARAATVPA
jgi:LysR family glycine cleavage system transcriptional activator